MRKHRTKEQKFLVEGERAVEQVLTNGLIEVESIFIKPSKLDHFSSIHRKMHLLENDAFAEISDTETPQGIIAVCTMPEEKSLKDLAGQKGLIVAVDGIQDPGNLGTIIRTAVWYGAGALLLGSGSVDVYNPKVVRSTAGATGVIPVCSGNLNDMLSYLEQHEWQTLLLDANEGAEAIQFLKPYPKNILVAGNEANGIDRELLTPERKRVVLPSATPQQHVESLNAGVAMSIALALVHN